MLRVAIGISLLAVLMLTYVANPVLGWVSMGALVTFVFAKRSRQAPEGGPEVRQAIRALSK